MFSRVDLKIFPPGRRLTRRDGPRRCSCDDGAVVLSDVAANAYLPGLPVAVVETRVWSAEDDEERVGVEIIRARAVMDRDGGGR